MNVSVDKTFEKDTDKINNRKLLLRVAKCIKEAKTAQSPAAIRNLKKMKGFLFITGFGWVNTGQASLLLARISSLSGSCTVRKYTGTFREMNSHFILEKHAEGQQAYRIREAQHGDSKRESIGKGKIIL